MSSGIWGDGYDGKTGENPEAPKPSKMFGLVRGPDTRFDARVRWRCPNTRQEERKPRPPSRVLLQPIKDIVNLVGRDEGQIEQDHR